MPKYVHPHVRQMADDKKVVSCMERIVKAFDSFHNNARAWDCLTIEDARELRNLEERAKAIHAKYSHNR